MEYRKEIDGLRAIAVIPVILFHAGFDQFSGGFVGVDIFFVISGYLITTIILSDLNQNKFSIVNFYERRARRIAPALFVVILTTVPLAWLILLPGDLIDFSQSLIAVSLFVSNILFWRESGYFATASELKPLLHTWSLAVEEQYYVLFPLLLIFLWPLRKRWLFSVILIICVGSLGLSHWAAFNKPSANFFLLPTRAWELMIGAITAFILIYWKNNHSIVNEHKITSELLGITGILLISFSTLFYDKTTPFPSLYALVPTVGTALIILFSSSKTFIGQILSIKALVGIGLISYSAYLWHQPLFAFARYKFGLDLSAKVYFILIFFTFLLALISWKFVESPFRNKRMTNRKNIFTFTALGTVIMLSVGSIGNTINGVSPFLSRDVVKRDNLVRQNYEARQNIINAGTCHFNKKGKYKNIDEFLMNWSCLSDDDNSLTNTKIGVFGDSHSADKAVALKQNGLDVVQIGGAGCPLNLSTVDAAHKYCNRLFDSFNKVENIEVVLIANRFTDDELTVSNIKNIITYWSHRFQKVVLFSPMPEFTESHKMFIRTGRFLNEPSLEYHKKFFDLVESIEIPKNFLIVDTKILFCGETEECKGVKNDKLLLTDYGHLTVFGATEFGKRLVASPYWEFIE
jgi:peptidoglycan/LPS O-acetylase OafA/YrhL